MRKDWLRGLPGRLVRTSTMLGAMCLMTPALVAANDQDDQEETLAPAYLEGVEEAEVEEVEEEADANYPARILQTQNPPSSAKIPAEGEPGAPESPGSSAPAAVNTPESEEAGHEAEEEAAWSLTKVFDNDSGGNWMTDHQLKVGGSTVQSVTFNFDSPVDNYNGPVTWTDRSNEYQFNQQLLYFERVTNLENRCFDIGARADILWGTNARFTTQAGLEDNINRQYRNYGLAIPQFYVQPTWKDLNIKLGHFYSPVGYFVVDTSQNFFNTLPYTYQYGEPFTHTGALASWTVNEHFVLGGGFTRGWDNFDGSGYGSRNLGYIGTAAYTWTDKSSLAFVNMWSTEPNGFFDDTGTHAEHSGRYFQTIVYSKPFCEKWLYVAQTDFGTQGGVNSAAAVAQGNTTGNTARWYGLNQYLFYTQNEHWTWGANFEWFRDESGARVGGFLPNLPNTVDSVRTRGLSPAISGFAGNFFQVTVGPKINFNKNIFLRPNLRFDWYGGNPNNAGLLPFDAGTKRNQTILGTDLAIVY